MHPAALVLTRYVVVRSIEVGDQRALERGAEYPFGDCSRTAVVVLVIALTLRGTEAPDVAVVPSLTPPCLIAMYHPALSHLLLDGLGGFFHSFGLCDSVQKVCYLTRGDEQVVHSVQVLSNQAHR